MDQYNHPSELDTPELPSAPNPAYRPVRKRSGHKGLIVSLIILLLLAAAAGGYWYVKLRAKPTAATDSKTTTSATSKPTPVAPQNSATSTPAGMTNYVSTQQDLNLSFDYPSDWQVTPKQTTPAATTPITITSASTTVASADGASSTGRVVVTIRPGGGAISELISASAAQDSAQIGYTHPTASQHQYPFLTFVHLAAASKAPGAFEEVIITGIQQFKKGDVVSADNLGTIDPLISAGFYKCATTDCPTSGAPTLSISNATWQSASLFTTTQALFSSFKLN